MDYNEVEDMIQHLIITGQFNQYSLLTWFLTTPLQPMLISQMSGYISR